MHKRKPLLKGRIGGTLLTFKRFKSIHPKYGQYSEFECHCGNVKTILHSEVICKHSISCGCLKKYSDMPQMLQYVRHNHNKTYEYNDQKAKKKRLRHFCYGLYRCECGTEKVILDSSVRINKVRSCGCLKHKHIRLKNILESEDRKKKEFYEERFKIEEPIGSGKFKWVTEKELEDMYYGFNQEITA